MNSGRLGRLSLSYFGKVNLVPAALRVYLQSPRTTSPLLMTYAPMGTATVSMPARGSLGVRLGVLVDRERAIATGWGRWGSTLMPWLRAPRRRDGCYARSLDFGDLEVNASVSLRLPTRRSRRAGTGWRTCGRCRAGTSGCLSRHADARRRHELAVDRRSFRTQRSLRRDARRMFVCPTGAPK